MIGNEKIKVFNEVIHKTFNNVYADAINYYRKSDNKLNLINGIFNHSIKCMKEEGRLQIFGAVGSLFTYVAIEYAHMFERNDYDNIINELTAVLIKKNTLYGDSFFNMMKERGIESGFDRLYDKINRFNSLYKNPEISDFESLSDNAFDIMGYCYLILVFLHFDYVEKVKIPKDAIKLTLDVQYEKDIDFEYIGMSYGNLIAELSQQSFIYLCELSNTAKNTYVYAICLSNKNKNKIKAIMNDFISEIEPKVVRHIYNCSDDIK